MTHATAHVRAMTHVILPVPALMPVLTHPAQATIIVHVITRLNAGMRSALRQGRLALTPTVRTGAGDAILH